VNISKKRTADFVGETEVYIYIYIECTSICPREEFPGVNDDRRLLLMSVVNECC